MKSIQRTFEVLQRKHPFWSSFIVYSATIEKEQPNYRVIKQWFNTLVDKDDYTASDKTQLLAHLKSLLTPRTVYKTTRLAVIKPPKKTRTYLSLP